MRLYPDSQELLLPPYFWLASKDVNAKSFLERHSRTQTPAPWEWGMLQEQRLPDSASGGPSQLGTYPEPMVPGVTREAFLW